jgi:hypothetical protein
MRSTTLVLLAFTLGLAACDYVEDPTPPSSPDNGGGGNGGGGGDDTIVATRKVLLEDLTGHRCPNCPRAARVAQDLKDDVYGDDLVLVAIHAGFFSNPVPPIGDGQYDTDHRTEAGNAYNTAYGPQSYPIGLISRKPYNGSILVNDGSWGSAVADLIGTPTPFKLRVDTIITNGTSVSTEISLELQQDVTGDYNLVVYLVEDRVIDWQYDSESTPPDIPGYEHRHILRGNLNGTWGASAIAGGGAAGQSFSFPYTYTIPGNVVNVDNCYLVAWIYDVATDEVMQVEERKFAP